MSAKIFVSWSGELSKAVAESLRTSLRLIFQGCEPFLSSEDIQKGTRPLERLATELNNTAIGIICITRENLERPWVNFEAGALSKVVDDSMVIPLLIDMDTTDVPQHSPIKLFQMTTNQTEDLRKMFLDLNSNMPNPVPQDVLKDTVNRFLPDLEDAIASALEAHSKASTKTEKSASTEDMLREILDLARTQSRSLAGIDKGVDALIQGRHRVPGIPARLWSRLPAPYREDRALSHEMERMYRSFREEAPRDMLNEVGHFLDYCMVSSPIFQSRLKLLEAERGLSSSLLESPFRYFGEQDEGSTEQN